MGLRQADLAAAASVSDSTVSRVESGAFGSLSLGTVRAVAGVVGIQLTVSPRSLRGASIERQIDWRHAALVDAVVTKLTLAGWETAVEYSFNYFGDRGSVDVLGWHAGSRSLLVVEVKSELRNVQATLHALDIKRRVMPSLVLSEKGWAAKFLGVVLVLADVRVERQRVDRHEAVFHATLPARTVEIKRWLESPARPLRGIWFLQIPHPRGAIQRAAGHGGVRRPRGDESTAIVGQP